MPALFVLKYHTQHSFTHSTNINTLYAADTKLGTQCNGYNGMGYNSIFLNGLLKFQRYACFEGNFLSLFPPYVISREQHQYKNIYWISAISWALCLVLEIAINSRKNLCHEGKQECRVGKLSGCTAAQAETRDGYRCEGSRPGGTSRKPDQPTESPKAQIGRNSQPPTGGLSRRLSSLCCCCNRIPQIG